MTATRSDPADEIGAGILSRITSVVYWFVVVEALIVLTTAPALALVVLLAGEAGNAVLIGLCFLPVAPALSAAVFAWRVFGTDRDLAPARHFWRGYRLNWLDVLRWWTPTVALLTIIGFTLAHIGLAPALLVIAVAVLLWSAHALVLSSTLSLRTRDIARLAAYYLAARPKASLGVLSLLVVSGGIVYVTSDWVIVALAAPMTLALLRNADPVLRDAIERFTV